MWTSGRSRHAGSSEEEIPTQEFVNAHFNEVISFLITAALGWMGKTLFDTIQEQKALKKGVKAVLHDRLYQSARFYLKQGWVDVEGLGNLGIVYEAYHELHGNGTGTTLYNKVKALPVKEE